VKISPHPQGSNDWLMARVGIPTASEFAAFMVEQKTEKAKEAYRKYILRKLTETFPKDEFEIQADERARSYLDKDPWIQRGNALEPEARRVLAKKLGKEIVESGLIFHDSGGFAASPDGLVVSDDGETWEAGVEIKCHNLMRHLSDYLDGVLPDDHKHQVHGSMAVTGLNQWHYFGYYPNQPCLHLVIERDDFTDRLEAGLKTLVAEKAKMKAELARLWKSEFGEVKP